MTDEIRTRDFRLEYADEPERVIRGHVYTPAEAGAVALPGVIVVHGFKGFMDWGFFPELGRTLARHGMIAVAFNMSGSGVGEDPLEMSDDQAFERNTPSRELEDLECVRRHLDSGAVPGLDSGRVGVVGHSLGGGIALLSAERRGDYRAVVAWSSISRSDRYDEETARIWRAQGYLEVPNARTGQIHRLGRAWLDDVVLNREALDIRAACRRLSTPTLLIHGARDESVSFEEARALAGALRPGIGRLVAIEGAGHTFGAVHPFAGTTPHLERALSETVDFLVAHLG